MGQAPNATGEWGEQKRLGQVISLLGLPCLASSGVLGVLWATMASVESASCGAHPKPTVGSPATPQSPEGTGLQHSLSYLVKVRTYPLSSSISRAEACPEKAQQGPGLGSGSEPTSKGTHDPPALAEETIDCQKTPGRPCGSRPLLGLVRTLLPRSGLIQSWAVPNHAL